MHLLGNRFQREMVNIPYLPAILSHELDNLIVLDDIVDGIMESGDMQHIESTLRGFTAQAQGYSIILNGDIADNYASFRGVTLIITQEHFEGMAHTITGLALGPDGEGVLVPRNPLFYDESEMIQAVEDPGTPLQLPRRSSLSEYEDTFRTHFRLEADRARSASPRLSEHRETFRDGFNAYRRSR